VSQAEARRTAYAIAPGVLIAGLGGGMAFPILPLVGLQAGLSLPFIGVILAANRFGRVLFNPFVGAAVDRVGGKRVLLLGLLGQTVVFAMYLLGVVTGHPGVFFLVGRLLHGPASSAVFVSSQALALTAGGDRHKGMTAGIVRSAQAAGVPAGLVIGGILAGAIGPAWAFGAASVVPLVAYAAGQSIPDLRATVRRSATLVESFASLLDRRVAAIAGINFASYLAAQGVILTTLVLLVHQRGLTIWHFSDQTVSGIFMALLVLCLMATAPIAGRISDRQGWRALLIVGGLVVMSPGLVVTGYASTLWTFAAGITLVGLGMGVLTTPLLALLGDIVPGEARGSAVGGLQLFGDLGGVAGPILGTWLLQSSQSAAFVWSAVLVALMIPVALWLAGLERRALPAGA
jgi:MFS family permease